LMADGIVGSTTRTRLAAISDAVRAGCLPLSGRLLSEEPLTAEAAVTEEAAYTVGALGEWPEGCPWTKDDWDGDAFTEAFPPPQPGAVLYRTGSMGKEVYQIKLALRQKGYADPNSFGEKELYGRDTALAIQAFQSDHGLAVTGFVDSATWDALFS
ncbi:MAG: peptidoglycan-binding protein, partial [Clostridia bacterium]|nr:peptidoglycan-binding protein [Clostridia bacterium]